FTSFSGSLVSRIPGAVHNEGEPINEEDEARLSPLRHAHINMLGHYTFTLAEQVTKGHLRPLKQAEETDEWPL
ncbi:Tn3 family transposase, partial [Escherichia coli]|uniref:Tn3 family transposase n=1 Tax=Escherichia coli TaxID=562 RepID=UPI001319DAC3